MVSWNSTHGDLIGAFKTGFYGSISKLAMTSKDLLICGNWFSLLIIWQIHEAGLTLIPKRDPSKPNSFEMIAGHQEEMQKKSREIEENKEENKEEEEKKAMLPVNKTIEEVETLDKP